MTDVAKKGDLALIRPLLGGSLLCPFTWRVVRCTSDPVHENVLTYPHGVILLRELVNHIEPIAADGEWIVVVPTSRLLPIRDPDADVSTTTNKGVEA